MKRLVAALAGSVVVLAGCGGSTGTTSSTTTASTAAASGTASSGAWTGLGAMLAAWESAHPKNSEGCSAGGCYGGRVMSSGSETDEFKLLRTTEEPENRVTGFERAFPDGTSVGAAKDALLRLMPSDTRTTLYTVDHTETGSCGLWNLKSATLGKWFAGKKVGDPQGVIGVVLSTTSESEKPTFDSNNVSTAGVGVGPEEKGGNC